MKTKSVAIITIKEAARMSDHGRERIATWLERQAALLRRSGNNLIKRFTARYVYVAIFAASLICASLTITGCSSTNGTPPTREAIVYFTFKDIQTVAHSAMGVFADRVVLGKVSNAEKSQVEAAYRKYQDAFRVAFLAATQDWSKPIPDQVKTLLDELTKLIYKL